MIYLSFTLCQPRGFPYRVDQREDLRSNLNVTTERLLSLTPANRMVMIHKQPVSKENVLPKLL